jgi:hypothetical protein
MLHRLRALPPRQRAGVLLLTVIPMLSLLGGVIPFLADFFLAPVTWNDGFTSRLYKGEHCYHLAFADVATWQDDTDSATTQTLLSMMAGLYCTARLFGALEWLWPLALVSLVAGIVVLLTAPHPPTAPRSPVSGGRSGNG